MTWRLMLILILVGVVLIWYVQNQQKDTFDINDKNDEALNILKKRYANGEISLEEFEEKRDVLEDRY